MPNIGITWKGFTRTWADVVEVGARIEAIAALVDGRQDVGPVRRFDGEIFGSIRVNRSLFLEGAPSCDDLEPLEDGDYSVNATRLRGLEFDLPDFRREGYSRELSFVFAEFRDERGPAWHLVKIIPHVKPSVGVGGNMERADVCLSQPHAMFRYEYEHSMDDLLGWLKHYCLPGLFFSRYRDLSGYDRFRDIDPADTGMRERLFGQLLERISREICLD